MLPTVFLIHTCDIVSSTGREVKQVTHGAVTGTFSVGQTITGAVSLATGTIYAVGSGYLQYFPVTGTIGSAEIVTSTTGSATTTGAPVDAVDSFGVPIVVPLTQSDVSCRFISSSSRTHTWLNLDSGEHFTSLPKLLVASTITIYAGDQITGKQAGFIRTYTAKIPKAVYEPVTNTVSHYTVELEAVD